MNTQEIEMTVTCKPFTSFCRGKYHVLVDIGEHPLVRVWDSIGCIYTVCHSLSVASERAIIARARKVAACR